MSSHILTQQDRSVADPFTVVESDILQQRSRENEQE